MSSIRQIIPVASANVVTLRETDKRRSRRRSESLERFLVDCLLLAAAGLAAAFGSSAAGSLGPWGPWPLVYPAVVLILLGLRRAYRSRVARPQILDDLGTIIATTSIAISALISLRVLLTSNVLVADQSMRQWLFATVFLAAGRTGLVLAQVHGYRRGVSVKPTLIVGAGRVGQLAAARLLAQPEVGLRPVGFLDKEPLDGPSSGSEIEVLGASWDLERVVHEHDVEHVIIAFSTAPHDVLLSIVRRCEELGVTVSSVPRLFERTQRRFTVDHLGGLPLVSIDPIDPKGWHFAAKYALDRLLAAVILILSTPVLVAAAVAVLVSAGRPILFRQRRIGRDGRTFTMLKFRSMRDSPENTFDPSFLLRLNCAPGGVEGFDRRTQVGAFLRRTSIDELPQLLNVLKGEMSLVGPRPERPEFVQAFGERFHRYNDRHRVKSGITGWAQISGLRGKTSVSDRVEWDNWYIENWSLALDFKILLGTLASVFRTAAAE